MEIKFTAELENDCARIVELQYRRRASWYKFVADEGPLVFQLENLGCSFEYYSTVLHANISGGKDELISAVRSLRTAGFKTDNTPPAEHATQWSAMFHKKDQRVMLNFSSKVCQLIQTGTKTVTQEVPIYALKCGDVIIPQEEAKTS